MVAIPLWKRSLAEALGTFALTFAGCAAVITDATHDNAVGLVGIALTFGLIIGAMVISIGDVSGCHINPAVSIGFLLTGRFKPAATAAYCAAQCAGAIVAALLLRALYNNPEALGVTNPTGSDIQSLGMEIVATFFLMFVVLCVATGSKEQGLMAGIAIGAVIVLDILFAGPISGGSMNPARSLGPALVANDLPKLWIYIVGPIIGAVLAVGAWMAVVKRR